MILVSCGIEGEPIPPSVKPVKQKLRLSEIDPMQAEGAGTVEVKSMQELNMIGHDYNADFEAGNDNLRHMFERVKPQSGMPKKTYIYPLEK